jgi:hypothetical protein
MFRPIGTGNDGVSFANSEGPDEADVALTNQGQKGKGGKDKSQVICHKCGEKGHYANENKCKPTGNIAEPPEESGATMLMRGVEEGDYDSDEASSFLFVQEYDYGSIALKIGKDGKLPKTWILLDNQSTVDVFHNAKLLTNIRKSRASMTIHCNAGTTKTNLIGDLAGYGTVWYHPTGIANILSLSRVKKNHRITYDSEAGNQFTVHKKDGSARVFKESDTGLYYMDAAQPGLLLVNTVADNKAKYTNRDYSQAVLARKIQKMIGRPSTRHFIKIVENKLLPNCPITKADILAAEHIFGPDLGSIKGKTVRRTPDRIETQVVSIPVSIMSIYRQVVLGVDLMHVNRIAFYVTRSRNIKLGSVEHIANMNNKTLGRAIRQVQQQYVKRGFKITHLLADGQFAPLRGDLAEMGDRA